MAELPTTIEFPEPLPAERRRKDWVVETDGVTVNLTNLDKRFWQEEGYTKADLVSYYWNAADRILPYVCDRPLTMKRMPNGADGDFFYAKQVPPGAPSWLRTAPVVSLGDNKRVDYVIADNRAALLWLANAGCIELHPWHSRVDQLGRPDYAFFDLDPMGAATFDDAREVALLVRTVLEGLGLRGYARTSGATGMQVFVPLDRVHGAETVRAWVGKVCELINRADPDRTTMVWDVARRGDAVFLDHNMNTEGKNIAATWCLRPERAAPVATPYPWDVVAAGVAPTDSTIETVWRRPEWPDDPNLAMLAGGQDLRAALRALGMSLDADADRPRHRIATEAPRSRRHPDRPGDLQRYRSMRDFAVTPEPDAPPEGPSAPPGNRFVLQHHLATRLHHDLRLEHDGVARSWALPKGLPEVPGLRHLAVPTEDHPIEYMTFEGRIPEGEYGAGAVRIWDTGEYEPLEWADGKVTVRLRGRRHGGEYHLFRTSRDGRGGRGSKEEWMVTRAAPGAEPPAPPPVVDPMLATLHDEPFDDDGWVFEVKWDGVRAIATTTRPGFGEEGSTRLRSRQGNDITSGYPELAAVWERVLAFNAVLDGEIVLLGRDAKPDFQALQKRMHLRGSQAERAAAATPVAYVVFDVVALDGRSLMDEPLSSRLEALRKLVVPGSRVVVSEVVRRNGRQLHAAVSKRGLEGIVAKRLSSVYRPGKRSPDWRKIKVRTSAEVVIGGWLPGEGGRAATLGALLVGEYDDDGALCYAGRVGTGFDDAELARLSALLAEHEAPDPPFADLSALPPEAHGRRGRARWCRPELHCRVEYAERTAVGRLRAPSYKGLVTPAAGGAER